MNGNFVLIDALPDAYRVFTSTYKSISDIKSTCIVALDTNVLLAPYKLGASSFKSIIEIYSRLANEKRLVLPAHVAREYARQRTVELSNLVKTLRDQSSRAASPTPSTVPFLEGNDEYRRAKEASEDIERRIRDARKSLDAVISNLSDPINGDPVLGEYSRVFGDCIHDIAIDDRDLFEQNCDYRFENGIPPGYQDGAKSNNAIGDVIIWKTIIDSAKKKRSDVIFVTGDEKSDWWVRHDKTPFQPRYELLDEFSRETSGQTIHLVPLHRLVELFEGTAAAVEETERVEREVTENAIRLHIPTRRTNSLMSELRFLRRKQIELEHESAALAANPHKQRASLALADDIASIKNRIRSVERLVRADDSGPDYSRADMDE